MAQLVLLLGCSSAALQHTGLTYWRIGSSPAPLRRTIPPILAASDDDEIAALQARLDELQRARAAEEAEAASAARSKDTASIASDPPAPPKQEAGLSDMFAKKIAEDPVSFDPTTLSYRSRVAADKSKPPSEFLSEAWKEDEGKGGGIGGVLPVVGGAVLLVLLLALSQVPYQPKNYLDVGEQAVPVETPAQLKARYGASGYE